MVGAIAVEVVLFIGSLSLSSRFKKVIEEGRQPSLSLMGFVLFSVGLIGVFAVL